MVRFSGYGNEEEQDLADILPPLSNRDSPRQDAMRVGSTNHLVSCSGLHMSQLKCQFLRQTLCKPQHFETGFTNLTVEAPVFHRKMLLELWGPLNSTHINFERGR